MKTTLFNASPKRGKSASGFLLEKLKARLKTDSRLEWNEGAFYAKASFDSAAGCLRESERWVFAFPLYVDGLPGHFLDFLVRLPNTALDLPQHPRVYAIVNSGFYEGKQNELALEILSNCCARNGWIWSGGIGVGGGPSLAVLAGAKNGRGPMAPVDAAIDMLAQKIIRGEAAGTVFTQIAMPRFLYKLAGEIGWRQSIRANGGRPRDLGKRPGAGS